MAYFHHVALITADADRSERFYRDVLGLTLLGRRGRSPDAPGTESRTLLFGDASGSAGSLVELREVPATSPGRPGAGGIHHHAFTTETPELQLMWKRWLEDAGVPVSGPYDRGWFRSIYFRDPDGQILEIATRGPGYTLDEAADRLGAGVMVPPTAELRGSRDEDEIRRRTHAEPVPAITPAMRLDGLHHISGITDDVERIGDFYEATLGLRLVKRSVNQDDAYTPHWFWAEYDGARVTPRSSLTMFGAWPNGGAPLPGTMRRAVEGAGQTRHIAFGATDEDELRGLEEHLRTVGVTTSPIADAGFFRAFEFRAPDGLLMAVATHGPETYREQHD